MQARRGTWFRWNAAVARKVSVNCSIRCSTPPHCRSVPTTWIRVFFSQIVNFANFISPQNFFGKCQFTYVHFSIVQESDPSCRQCPSADVCISVHGYSYNLLLFTRDAPEPDSGMFSLNSGQIVKKTLHLYLFVDLRLVVPPATL